MSDYPSNPNFQTEIPETISWEQIPTSVEDSPKYQQKLEELLVDKGWDKLEAYRVSYAFHEILNNAIVHGNLNLKKQPGERETSWWPKIHAAESLPENANKFITVSISLTANQVIISIQDQGTNSPEFWKKETVGMRTGTDTGWSSGRGIQISETFLSKIEYEKNNTGIKAILTKIKETTIPKTSPIG
ncbi:MAG: ATP-binding protein [Candidatus Doudnabacteria bacterium]|jgi:anti-sigma regulatory factor (Ser/Thr protein kinase)